MSHIKPSSLYISSIFSIIFVGFLFQFLIVMLFSFWLLHIVHIWISVAFPHIAKKVKKYDKLIHVIAVVLIVIFSLIGPVVAVAKYPYTASRLPTLACISSDLNWNFYSLILPCCLVFALASTFLILVFNTTYKVRETICCTLCLTIY